MLASYLKIGILVISKPIMQENVMLTLGKRQQRVQADTRLGHFSYYAPDDEYEQNLSLEGMKLLLEENDNNFAIVRHNGRDGVEAYLSTSLLEVEYLSTYFISTTYLSTKEHLLTISQHIVLRSRLSQHICHMQGVSQHKSSNPRHISAFHLATESNSAQQPDMRIKLSTTTEHDNKSAHQPDLSDSFVSGADGHFCAYRWRGPRQLPAHVAQIKKDVIEVMKTANIMTSGTSASAVPEAATKTTRSGRQR